MNSEKLWQQLTELSIVCGMNERYAQHMLSSAQTFSHLVDACVLVSTVVCLALVVAAYFSPKGMLPVIPRRSNDGRLEWLGPQLDGLSMVASLLAAIAGIVLVALPTNEDVHYFASMKSGWGDLRQEVDSVLVETEAGESTEFKYLGDRYKELLVRKNALNERETKKPDVELLEKYLAMEEKSRGVDPGQIKLDDDIKSKHGSMGQRFRPVSFAQPSAQ